MTIANRPSILLLIPHLGGGGAEQVAALLARGLSREKYRVHLGLIVESNSGPKNIPPRVEVHEIAASRVRNAALPLLRLVRELKPDVILSGMFHLNFLVLLLRPFFPRETSIIVRQNGMPAAALAAGNLPIYTRLLYKLLYPRANRIICQSQAMAKELSIELGIDPRQLAVLPNPVDLEAIRSTADAPQSHRKDRRLDRSSPHLLAVGRLAPEKGFDLLLQAFEVVRRRFSLARLTILGSGPAERSLKSACQALGLNSAVRFAGHVDDPCTYFSDATAFVLSSRHEGMPNALLEAAAAGLPIVATPASGGVIDLLRDQPGAWVASGVSHQALAEALIGALQTLSPGQRYAYTFIENFAIDHAVRAYQDLIDAVLSEAASHAAINPRLLTLKAEEHGR
jgi:glycosyltransferase involved in cell wall biosynthesis